MNAHLKNEVARPLLSICPLSGEQVRVDILRSGQVRLRVNDDPARELVTETLEELLLLAPTLPYLSSESYEQLHWELDMLAQHGS